MNTYYYNINEFYNPDDIELLTENRRAKFERLRQPKDKARCLAAGLLLRRFLNVTDDTQLVIGAHGKPYLKNSPIYFNLSHSGDYVVLSVADCEVGIDIEKINTHHRDVAKRFFTPEENEWLRSQTVAESFFDIWTAKEAVTKAAGIGLSFTLSSFSVLPVQNGPHLIHDQIWHLFWYRFNHHSLCIAAEKPQETIRFIPVTYRTLID